MAGAAFLSIGSGMLLFYRGTFIDAAGILTVVGVAVVLVGLATFGANDLIHWPAGVALLVSKAAGSYRGAGFALHIGEVKIRLMFIVIVLASVGKLMWE